MKYLTTIFLALAVMMGSLGTAQAQERDQKAEQILKKVKDKYAAYQNMKVEFTQEIKNPESDLEQKINGTLYIKGDKFRLEIADQIMISDSKNFWIYFEPEQEVIIDRVDQEGMFKPSDIFNLYDKDFLYKMAGTGTMAGKKYHIIQFTPKPGKAKDEAFFHTIKLYVDQIDNSVKMARITDKNNTTMTYTINKISPNQNLTDANFTWDKSNYPKVTVTDKRND